MAFVLLGKGGVFLYFPLNLLYCFKFLLRMRIFYCNINNKFVELSESYLFKDSKLKKFSGKWLQGGGESRGL